MNDPTELDSSLAGAIDFFQNLHRKLGALEADSGGHHDRLQAVTATVAALEQDRQQFRQSLATLASELRSHGAELRQEMNALEKGIVPAARITALEDQIERHQARLGELQLHQERLKHLDILIGKVAADTNSTRQILNVLQADLTTQSDTLRELDQSWRESLAAYQDRLSQLEPAAVPPSPAETSSPETRQLRQDFDSLQEMVTALATRLIGQAQTFGESLDQVRGLNAEIRHLQQQSARLESLPRQLSALEQGLAVQRQEMVLLNDATRQLQADSQQFSETLRQGGHDPRIAEMEIRLNEQAEQLTGLNAAVETLRTDTRTTQEKFLTLATSVAKRIHDFQNQMTATETAQGERLQEIEQKLVWLQASLETLETRRKPRRWFSMPATFSTLALAAGATLLAILAQVIRTIG